MLLSIFQGLDCEYRHNEIARLNPRDCWYWLVGNCLNPTCGFRHPVSSFFFRFISSKERSSSLSKLLYWKILGNS